jgi:3-methyladenine DNA glycosylase AlkD
VLWDEATHREERYAATALARHRTARPWQDPAALDLYRHLVVTGAWWDHVDEVASQLVGGVLAGHRDDVTPVMRAWAVDDDLWVRRTAVLCQLNHRAETDVDLLRDVVEANVDDRSFWLRKAIGWALREHAKTDPDWVRAEVHRLGDRLSGLSRREALRHLTGSRDGR